MDKREKLKNVKKGLKIKVAIEGTQDPCPSPSPRSMLDEPLGVIPREN